MKKDSRIKVKKSSMGPHDFSGYFTLLKCYYISGGSLQNCIVLEERNAFNIGQYHWDPLA